ncbi:hypothetical protein KOR42_53650 [Thalassoglobus neptunius]|uniref:Uncharacterized protein n=1 Tax=Thalassoglobus neptunius TaxID=1938619 RepID=A0A5C5V9K3_9PLAN|nr:hypothetical protein [Thalassoglobus neptunius]TWT34961.1 hypothetical protein KOR42_53650 [Thalassoglobus neptunius]
MKTSHWKLTIAALSLGMFVVGCGIKPAEESSAENAAAQSEENDLDHGEDGEGGEGDHAHGPGPHGGTVADWGGGAYHVEFTVDHDKKEATVYILGSDEKSPEPIAAGSVLLNIKEPSLLLELLPMPLDGEGDGQSSRFVGTHEELATVTEYEGTISGLVDGTPYAGNFSEVAQDPEH